MIESIENILKKLKADDVVCLIHHDDGDGCSSAALFSIIVNNLTGSYPILFPLRGANSINKRLLSSLKVINPELTVTLDLSIDPKKLNIFSGFILDHHIFGQDIKTSNMLYLNPRFFEKNDNKVVPTSFMIYKVLKKMFPEEGASWIGCIGVTEDHRVETCKEIFEDTEKNYPNLIKTKITQEDIENSIFGIMWDMIRSGRMVKGEEGTKTSVLSLIECKDRPDQFINGLTTNSYSVKKFYEKMVSEIENSLNDFEKTATFYRDKKVVVFEPKKVNLSGITSFLSDKIRKMYPEWIVCVVNRNQRGGKVKISIRIEQNKRETNLVELLEKIKINVPSAIGGGHKSAIGINMDIDELNNFFEELLASV